MTTGPSPAGAFEFGYLGSEVGKYLYLGSSGVSLAAKRGEKYLKAERW